MKTFLLTSIALISLAACGKYAITEDADEVRAKQTAVQMQEAVAQVPLPNIKNFQELRWATYLYELRDQATATYAYFTDLNGNKHFICDSVGYGMPASVQITNPERVEARYDSYGLYGTLPQAEPNGLFMPDTLSATYILCSDGKGGIAPVYIEDNVVVSPFKMH